ncbi:hypothetical protein [Gorillibacterium massiliense]|uniref:hypothetical protein n=1 Tax=Gorillibacterium massiliense TaxID=1280390 RepID=UPI0004B55A14|nr:hypothetical protein [Gorillibacterium massiliense]
MRNKAAFFVMPLVFLFFLAGCRGAAAGTSSDLHHKNLGIQTEATGRLDADIQNQWNGFVDGKYLEVYAGVRMKSIDSTNQGQLIVYHEVPKDSGEAGNDAYFTPGKHGWVKITAENKGILVLVSEDGTTFHFDLRKRAYTNDN